MTNEFQYVPNVFIIGAPKCGTSSLHNWLCAHPNANGSIPKEPFFLMDPSHPLANRKRSFDELGWRGYEFFFAHSQGVKIESTTHYLFQTDLPEILGRLPVKPKLIAVLRNPSDRIYSSFLYSQNNLAAFHRPIDFSTFVSFLLAGRGDKLSAYTTRAATLETLKNDLLYSQYEQYLAEWFAVFNRDQFEVVIFEHMIRNKKEVVKQVADKIDLDASFFDTFNFDARNKTQSVRHRTLHSLAIWMNKTIRFTGPMKKIVKDAYSQIQGGAKIQRTEEDTKALLELDKYFEPFNDRLAKRFDLDLSVWNKKRQA